jgi:exopolyphosphatase/guanosine-5'-triphosphate,3'-diphosphate pyrophosphatase
MEQNVILESRRPAVAAETGPPPRRVAVVDIGTTSIRMSIAEISGAGKIRTLETLYQAVSLGRDTFTTGGIASGTIEESVRILRSYRQLLEQYEVVSPDQIRVVATSAVHESSNQLHFIDRVYIATGLQVEPLDDAEANRFAFLAVQPVLEEHPELRAGRTLMTEVGGGNTETLLFQEGNVILAHTYRLGSVRLRQTLQAHRTSSTKLRKMMESEISRAIEQVAREVGGRGEGPLRLLALGGDVRFAISHLFPDAKLEHPVTVPLSKLAALSEKVLTMGTDDLVRRFHLALPDAETLAPALLAYVQLARDLKLDEISVTRVNFRDGLLKEMAFRGVWPEQFSKQIIRAAIDLGRRYRFHEDHGLHTGALCQKLFRALAKEHSLEPRYELLLYLAALLHDVGNFISNRSHHKHSMYLILLGELFGLSHRELLLVALIARYHRRSSPKPTHEGYLSLDRQDRITVAKLAAILRVADALDRSERQRIQELECRRERDRFIITTPLEDVSLEQLALQQKGSLFQEVYGMPIRLRKTEQAEN